MMFYFKPVFQFYFVTCVCLYILIRIDRVTQWFRFPSFIRYNFNDFLCLPIILTLTICILRYLKRDQNIELSGRLIFGEAVFYSVLFEFLLPIYSMKYTADLIDVLMYVLGAWFYGVMMKRNDLVHVN